MHTRIILAFLLIVVAIAGAGGCRHFGAIDEADAGPGPHCDPCAEYTMAIIECVKAACAQKGCAECPDSLHLAEPACAGTDAGTGGFDGTIEIGIGVDAGITCTGAERDDAYQKLLQFSCEDDPRVSGYLLQLENVVCSTCLAAGEACPQGFCYYAGSYGSYTCMPAGSLYAGDSCSSFNACRNGAQCVDAGGPALCYDVCQSDSSCGTSNSCEDTGLGFKVCVAGY